MRALKLTASMQSDRRKSNEPGFDYKSNSFGRGGRRELLMRAFHGRPFLS
jgi:hypothetical protein